MASTKRSCVLISLLLFLLLASTINGARLLADANDTGGDHGRRVTVREGVGGHGHGYSSSHRSHNPDTTPDAGGNGTPVVDPHNVATRGHHHRGAAARGLAPFSRLATCALLGATFSLLLL